MSNVTRHFVKCDHMLCFAMIEGMSKNDAHDNAVKKGWKVRREGRQGRTAHYCPEHQ